jgi:hypothetical protein
MNIVFTGSAEALKALDGVPPCNFSHIAGRFRDSGLGDQNREYSKYADFPLKPHGCAVGLKPSGIRQAAVPDIAFVMDQPGRLELRSRCYVELVPEIAAKRDGLVQSR